MPRVNVLYSARGGNMYNTNLVEHEVGGTCGTNGEKRNVYRLLAGNPEGKISI
jgi:hypothetical protein